LIPVLVSADGPTAARSGVDTSAEFDLRDEVVA
jgi:hypothetical protein